MALSPFTAFAVEPGEDMITWDFTSITEAGESSGMSYSGGAFANGSALYYEIKKNSGLLEFTPSASGTLKITAAYADKVSIIVDTDNIKNNDDDVYITVDGNTAELEKGVKYYIYNPNSGYARVTEISFTQSETQPEGSEIPTESAEATATPTTIPSDSSNTITWDFTSIAEAGESRDMSYSGGAFADGSALFYEIKKNSGLLEYTPSVYGTLKITATYADKVSIIVDADNVKNNDDDVYITADSNTAELKKGVKYYIYNPNSGYARITKITFTPYEEQPTDEPTATPTSMPTATPTVTPATTASPFDGADYYWNLTDIADKIGYDQAEYQSGAVYDYNGIFLNGASGAIISDRGAYFTKNEAGKRGYIKYTPDKFGTLDIKIKADSGAELYVEKAVDSKTTAVIKAPANGSFTGSKHLDAGTTYYIFNSSSKVMYIEEMAFTFDEVQPTMPPTPVPTIKPVTKPTAKPSEEQQIDAATYYGDTFIIKDSSTYPINPANSNSKYDIVSGLDTSTAQTHIMFDMTLNTLVKTDTQPDGTKAYDGFSLEFTNVKSKAGGVLVAADTITVDGEDAVTFKWRSGGVSWAMSDNKGLKVGHTYTLDFTVKPVVTSESGAKTYYLDMDIYDEEGKLYESAEDLSCRSASGYTAMIVLGAQPRVQGEEGSVTIDNIKKYLGAPVQTIVRSDKINGGQRLEPGESYETVAERFTNTEYIFDEPISVFADGNIPSYITSSLTFEMADGSELVSGLSAEGNTLKVSSGLAAGVYEVAVITDAKCNGASVLSQSYSIKLRKQAVVPEDIIDDYIPEVTSDGAVVADNADVYSDLTLPATNAIVAMNWTSSNNGVISDSGVVTRPKDDTEVTLTAIISSVEKPEFSKTYTLKVNVKGTGEMLDNAIAIAKAAIVSADDKTRAMDAEKLADLHEDIKLYTKYNNSSYTGYEDVIYTWTSNSDILKISGDVAEIYPIAAQKYNVVLTLKASAYGSDVTEEIPVTVNLTADNAADKYAVRCDDIAPANFNTMAGYTGSVISSDITVPTTGVFGSDISWTSSMPTYLSNTGKYNAPSSNTTATMTGVVSRGTVSSDSKHEYKITLKGKNSNASSGGGGGGGSSSSGKTITAPIVSVTAAPAEARSNTAKTQSSKFTDMSDAQWAIESVEALADMGIISGRTDTTYAPNENITRAEFAKIIVNAFMLGDDTAEVDVFSDVNKDDWYYEFIAAAYNIGIINGYDDGSFGVNDNITRQDMAVIIYRAAQAAGKSFESMNEAIDFADGAYIADYAKEAVSVLQTAGIINGMSDTEFAPAENATRAQAAKITYEIIK